jgi:hypothetical protein
MSMYLSFHGLAAAKSTVWKCSDGKWLASMTAKDDGKGNDAEEVTFSTKSCETRDEALAALFSMVRLLSDSVMRVQLEESVKDKEATLIANGSESV